MSRVVVMLIKKVLELKVKLLNYMAFPYISTGIMDLSVNPL